MARAGAFSLVISLVALVLTAVVFFHSDFQQGSEVTLGRNILSGVHEESGRFARKLFAGDEVAAPSRINNLAFLKHSAEPAIASVEIETPIPATAAPVVVPSKGYTPGVCGASFSGFNFYPAVHHKGDDLRIISHTVLPECIDACRGDAACVGVVYSEALASTCWLKSALGSGIPSDVADTFAVCTASSPPPPMDPSLAECGRIVPGYSALHNTDFSGTELSAITGASPQSCAETCHGISTCVGFAFSKHMETCWLRSALGAQEDSHHLDFYKVCSKAVEAKAEAMEVAQEAVETADVPMERGRSLVELCGAEVPGYVHHASTYFTGADLASYTGESVQSCAAKCDAMTGCHGFVWSESISEGTCFLKSEMREGSTFPGVGSYTACDGSMAAEESVHPRSAKSTSFVASHLHPGFEAVTEAAAPKKKSGSPSVCSSNFIYLRAYTEADLYKRRQWPNTTSVHLAIQNSLTLQNSFIVDASFACTVIEGRPSNQTGPVVITSISYVYPPLLVQYTSNVFIRDITWQQPFTAGPYTGSSLCPYLQDMQSWTYTCPTVQVWRSFQIRFSGGSIGGRLDLFRVANILVDSMSINGNVPDGWNSPGAVRTGIIGDPNHLIGANVVISNNEIWGGSVGVMVAWQTVGIEVKNNYFHSYSFAAVQCGITIHNVADCVVNHFDNNFMTSGSGYQVGDGAGFYVGTHWTGIGNTMTCNYIVNTTGHCYYFDAFSSGSIVNGGYCQTSDGVKINTGKANVVNNLIVRAANNLAEAISCQNYYLTNCESGSIGNYYLNTLFQYYWTSSWETPTNKWLEQVCQNSSIYWNGQNVPCNPAGAGAASTTGKCSGLPYHNDVNVISLDTPHVTNRWSCNSSVPTVPLMNTQAVLNCTTAHLKFNDAANYDYGIDDKTSPIYSHLPYFKSCPVSLVGPQTPTEIIPITAHSKAFTRAVKKSLDRQIPNGRFGV